MSMPAIYSALGRDEARNSVIFDDVLTALDAGRSPLILTERRDHLETLRLRFEKFTRNLVVLHGGLAAGGTSYGASRITDRRKRGAIGTCDRTLSRRRI
jgi:hypothetical protein